MRTEINPESRNKTKKNFKFFLLLIFLCLLAWFGVKMIVSESTPADTSARSEQNNPILQFGGTGTNAPPAGGMPPSGGPPIE